MTSDATGKHVGWEKSQLNANDVYLRNAQSPQRRGIYTFVLDFGEKMTKRHRSVTDNFEAEPIGLKVSKSNASVFIACGRVLFSLFSI